MKRKYISIVIVIGVLSGTVSLVNGDDPVKSAPSQEALVGLDLDNVIRSGRVLDSSKVSIYRLLGAGSEFNGREVYTSGILGRFYEGTMDGDYAILYVSYDDFRDDVVINSVRVKVTGEWPPEFWKDNLGRRVGVVGKFSEWIDWAKLEQGVITDSIIIEFDLDRGGESN